LLKVAFDRLISETNASGKTRRFSFDARDRLTKAISFSVFSKPAIASMIDFCGGDRN
jgi:YD repeat-containing protein